MTDEIRLHRAEHCFRRFTTAAHLTKSDDSLIGLDDHNPLRNDNEVVMTFDPFAVVKVNVRA